MLKDIVYSTFSRRFAKNDKGTAAIEFAFIAPIMIVVYFGLAAVSLLVSTDRNVSHATSVTADLITQNASLDNDEIEDIFNATLAVLGITSSDTQNVSIDVRSFAVDGGGTVQEVGYAKLGSGLSTKYTPPNNIASSLLNQTSGLVVTRIEYNYQSLGYYMKTANVDGVRTIEESFFNPTLSETFMLKPRKNASIAFDNSGSSTVSCSYQADVNPPRVSC